MKVILAQPRGFCAGVVRAIEIVERALQKFGPPVYVRHEIVHNKHVVESLKAKGAHFVEDLWFRGAWGDTVTSTLGTSQSSRASTLTEKVAPTMAPSAGSRIFTDGVASSLMHPNADGFGPPGHAPSRSFIIW